MKRYIDERLPEEYEKCLVGLNAITKDDLEKIIVSLDNMAEKLQRNLLENLPSEESNRAKLDDYKELRENIAKILNLI